MKETVLEFDIAIRVKPDLSWVQPVEAAARSYLTKRAFPHKLIEQTSAAVVEATEQLIALCARQNVSQPFEVGFVWREDAVQVHLVYDASIPLHPHQEADYEVPSVGAETGGALEGLWLHIIKCSMDRVFFRIDGKRASLVMMKYCRAERQARQLWVMSLMPKLRAGLAIERSAGVDGRPLSGDAIIHDTYTQKVLKLSPSDTFILSRLDGKNTLEDIYLDHAAELGPVSPEHVKRLYEALESAGMLEGASAGMMRKARWLSWLSPVFSIPRPDEAVTWLYRRLRFMFNPLGVAALFLTGLSGLLSLFMNWSAIKDVLPRTDEALIQHPGMIAIVYLIILANVALHEFAHGVTCKHFGGRISKLGIMWYLAMFIFFCDVTSAWTFPKKSQRIWVSLAGPLVSWAFFGVTAWCAGATAASASPWAALWIMAALIVAVSLVMNFNPFIRMDAYYLLVDWTGIPNLQKQSFTYIGESILRFVKKPRFSAEPVASIRERNLFLIYGWVSAVMSFFFILLPFWWLIELWVTNRQFTTWGVITFIVVTLLIGGMLFKAHEILYAARHREYKLS